MRMEGSFQAEAVMGDFDCVASCIEIALSDALLLRPIVFAAVFCVSHFIVLRNFPIVTFSLAHAAKLN